MRLREHNLKLKPAKCVFGAKSIRFLGHIVSADGIKVDPSRIEKVKTFPIPKNPSQVRSFHGLVSYNRKFIKDFASIAKPLTPLMGKVNDFRWSSEAQVAFERLRDALIEAPILVHFDPEAELELRTDASSFAIGAVLFQKHQDAKKTGVLLYFSKTLSAAQRNYSATEREALAAFTAITELQHYLYGKRFILVTDHAALSLLKNHKNVHQRLARWVAQLQCYEFEVKYKSGATHLDADCLSRLIDDEPHQETEMQSKYIINALIDSRESQNSVSGMDIHATPEINIKDEQITDQYCLKYLDILRSTNLTESEKAKRARNFVILDDLLYRVQNDIPILVIPTKLRQSVLQSCHDLPLTGHMGFRRTYGSIKCRYYWPRMRRDIKQYVASCPKCQKRKARNIKRQGFTKPLPIAEDIFDTVGIDLINKLPRSYAGYNAILVVTDNLPKFVVTSPLRDEKATSIIFAFYTDFIAKFGCPKIVISDRGLNISSKQTKDFFQLYGIKRHLTSAYHPQSNGQTERYNRTLAASLTMYVDKEQKNWSDYLAPLTFAYNISEHSVTHVPPYELVYGRRPRLPLDNLLNREEFIDPKRPFHDIRSAAALEIMKKAISDSQHANKSRLDAKLKQCEFKIGDLVLFERPTRLRGQVEKLTYLYTGPYKITKKLGDITYELTAESNSSDRVTKRVSHPCSLKKYIPRIAEEDNNQSLEPDFVPKELCEEQPSDPIGLEDNPDSISTVSASEQGDIEIESPQFSPFTPRGSPSQ